MIGQTSVLRKRPDEAIVPRGTYRGLGSTWDEKEMLTSLSDRVVGPVDPRMASLTGNSARSETRPAKRASRYSAAAMPAARAGMRTLVSVGDTHRANPESPKPTTDSRPGT